MSGNFAKKIKKQGCEFLAGLFVKIPVALVIVLVLGYTYPGNWIKCKFFDSMACFPELAFEEKSVKLGRMTLKDIDKDYRNYKIIERLPNLEKHVIYEHKISIKSRGVYRIGQTAVKATFLPILRNGQSGQLTGYRIDDPSFLGNVNALKEKKEVKEKGIIIEPFQFSEIDWLGYQKALVLILVAYPEGLNKIRDRDLADITINCQSCRAGYTQVSGKIRKQEEVQK